MLWKEKENANAGCLQGQRSCMTVRQGDTFYSVPFDTSYILNQNANVCVFPPVGHISFSLACLYKETDHQELPLPTSATHQHHGLLSVPTSLTPVSNCKPSINSTGGKKQIQQTCNHTCLVTAHSISNHACPATSALSTGLSPRRCERRNPPVKGSSFGEGSLWLFCLV